MTILQFELEDLARGWHLQRLDLQPFNLIVGLSGVGKTMTLRALAQVAAAAHGGSHRLTHHRWSISTQTPSGVTTWAAETAPGEGLDLPAMSPRANAIAARSPRARFIYERLSNAHGTIAERQGDQVSFNGQHLRIKDDESLVSLLREEEVLAFAHPLSVIIISEASHRMISVRGGDWLRSALERHQTLDSLRADRDLMLVERAYILKLKHPDAFEQIKRQYQDIFESVEDVDVGFFDQAPANPNAPLAGQWLDLAIRERHVKPLISSLDMSSGMARTLGHLLELTLAPDGATILIDEFENSLGVNCLDAITDLIKDRAGRLQFIATSHHPQIINGIPRDWWLIMRRHGSSVFTQRAQDIPRLATASRLDAFTLLMNAPEYAEGIQ
jgi:hypothetical protein